jgi:hypothetical protein
MKVAFFIYRFKHKLPIPWTAITPSILVLVITFLVGYILYEAINRIATVEEDCQKMRELKARAEAADIAKSQVIFVNHIVSKALLVFSLKCFLFCSS